MKKLKMVATATTKNMDKRRLPIPLFRNILPPLFSIHAPLLKRDPAARVSQISFLPIRFFVNSRYDDTVFYSTVISLVMT